MRKFRLRLAPRLWLLGILPKTGPLIDMMIGRRMQKKLELTEKEAVESGIKFTGSGYNWGKDVQADIPFRDDEVELAKKSIAVEIKRIELKSRREAEEGNAPTETVDANLILLAELFSVDLEAVLREVEETCTAQKSVVD